MGAALTCVDREEPSQADNEAAYRHYSQLYHWVHSCLQDGQILERECSNAFQNAEKDEHGEVGREELWRLTQFFMNRCDCRDPHAVEAICGAYSFVIQAHPSISQLQFFDYMTNVFSICERDLRDKVAKFGLQHEHASRVTHPDSEPPSSYRVLAAPEPTRVQLEPTRLEPVRAPEPVRVPVGAKIEMAQPVAAMQVQQRDQEQQVQWQPVRPSNPTSPVIAPQSPLARSEPPRGGGREDPDAASTPTQNGTDFAVENTKRQILDGVFKVGVFNQKFQVELKNLKITTDIDLVTGQTVMKQLTIADEAGGANAAFQISDIVGISQGMTANIMDNPPPADRVVAFQFLEGNLCILFEDPVTCQLAIKALKQLCQVPVYST